MKSDEKRTRTRPWTCLAMGLVAVLLLVPMALAQEEPAPEAEPAPEPRLAVSQAQEFLGKWVLIMESQQGEFETDLHFQEAEGHLVAELEMPQLGSTTINTISRDDEGLKLRFKLSFGSQQFKINMEVARQEDELVGKLGDEAGFFTMKFRGLTEQAALALETADAEAGEDGRRRRRGRRGNTGTTRLTLAGQEVAIRFDKATTDQLAYERLSSAEAGTVVSFLTHRPSKLTTHVDLRFGETLIKKENVAKDYPGVYSLWLKKADDGWRLVFNQKPDVWGTQHDPESDVAEVPLALGEAAEEARTLTVELEETQEGDGGLLRIAWGAHEWTTQFAAATE